MTWCGLLTLSNICNIVEVGNFLNSILEQSFIKRGCHMFLTNFGKCFKSIKMSINEVFLHFCRTCKIGLIPLQKIAYFHYGANRYTSRIHVNTKYV